MRKIALFIGILLYAVQLQAAQPSVDVKEPWMRAPIGKASVTTAYGVLSDVSGQGDTLTAVEPVNGGTASLHETTSDNGIMRMRSVETLSIPAGGEVALKPGGIHIMLMDVPSGLRKGDTLPLRLRFKRQGDVVINFSVR